VIECNEWKTQKRHACANMGNEKRLKLWWQLYRTSLPERDVRNITAMDFCSFECTWCGILGDWFRCTLWCIFHSFILVVSVPPHTFVCTPPFGCCWLTELKKCEAEMASNELWYWILEYPFAYDVGKRGPLCHITVRFCSCESSLLVSRVVYHCTTPMSYRILS